MTTGGQLERLLWAAGEAKRLRKEAETASGAVPAPGPSESAEGPPSTDGSTADLLVAS
jgi:hypothetical protein